MKKKPNRSKKEKALRIIATVMGVVGVIVIALVCIHQVWVKPPQVVDPSLNNLPSPEAPKTEETIEETPLPTDTEKAEPTPETGEEEQREQISSNRQEGVYTILLVGNDDGQGNTDTILVGKIDTVQHKMDFVTIPRDTLINMPWPVRKINCVYWGSRYDNGDGITALKKQISRLTGFEPDCYVVVDLNVFIDAVDLIGGVYFDVPIDMNYEMPAQNLSIHLKKGYQLLNGKQAMGCVRFRKGYPNGDLGRIETQHKFLSACASQFLDAGNIPHMPELLKLLADNLDTDLTVANLTFFAEEFLKCKAEDIKFYTPELGGGVISGYSYVTLALDEWLDLVNEVLNPFNEKITRNNVDIVYMTPWGYEGTMGLRGAEYYTQTSTTDNPGEGGEPAPGGEGGEPAPGGEGGEPAPGGEGGEPAPGGEGGEPAPGGEGGEPAPGGEGGEPAPGGEGGEPADPGTEP